MELNVVVRDCFEDAEGRDDDALEVGEDVGWRTGGRWSRVVDQVDLRVSPTNDRSGHTRRLRGLENILKQRAEDGR